MEIDSANFGSHTCLGDIDTTDQHQPEDGIFRGTSKANNESTLSMEALNFATRLTPSKHTNEEPKTV